MTFIEFLVARIDEDEARCGGGDEPESWCDRASGVHYNPDRVLAEVAAKREIVAMHYDGERQWDWACDGGVEEDRPFAEWPCRTVRILAAIYADHPDYRDEWQV